MSSTLYHFGIKGMKWGIRRYQNKDGSLTAEGRQRYNDDYKRAHTGKKVSEMSDAELRTINNRLQMERQYANLTKKTSKGKQIVNQIVGIAGTISTIAGAYQTYKKYGTQAIEAIGDLVIDELKTKGI